jgi:hypothetical protein
MDLMSVQSLFVTVWTNLLLCADALPMRIGQSAAFALQLLTDARRQHGSLGAAQCFGVCLLCYNLLDFEVHCSVAATPHAVLTSLCAAAASQVPMT